MKRKLTKAQWEALSDELKKVYEVDGDSYILKIEGEDGVGELRRANERLKTDLAAATTDLTTARTERDKAIADWNSVSKEQKDVVALESSYKQKIADKDVAHTSELQKKDKQIHKLLIENRAATIAADISGDNAHLMQPIIERRLKVEEVNGEPTTRVLDVNGQPSASTVDELRKEIVDNPKYAAIVIGSKANGGGANGSHDRTNANGGAGNKKFAEMNDAERTAYFKRDPEGFKRDSEAAKAALRKF